MPKPLTVFQFLIGSLKTINVVNSIFLFYMFQFLIGSLKTRNAGCRNKAGKEFQFLIGSLKTHTINKQIYNILRFNSL